MQNDKLKGFLNICRKANYLIIGGEALSNYNKKLYLVLYDSSSKKNTLKIVEKFSNKGIKTIELDNLDTILLINNCKIVGIKNKNLSEEILKICGEEKE